MVEMPLYWQQWYSVDGTTDSKTPALPDKLRHAPSRGRRGQNVPRSRTPHGDDSAKRTEVELDFQCLLALDQCDHAFHYLTLFRSQISYLESPLTFLPAFSQISATSTTPRPLAVRAVLFAFGSCQRSTRLNRAKRLYIILYEAWGSVAPRLPTTTTKMTAG